MRTDPTLLISPRLTTRHRPWRRVAPGRVQEESPRYEDEGTVRLARGAVAVGGAAWWTATLAVPWGGEVAGRAQLSVRRRGPGEEMDCASELAVPVAEMEALLVLLGGVVAQARRDAVLGPATTPSDGPVRE